MKTAVGVYPSCIYTQPVVYLFRSWGRCAMCYCHIYPIGVGICCFFFLVPKGFPRTSTSKEKGQKQQIPRLFCFSCLQLCNLKYKPCSCFRNRKDADFRHLLFCNINSNGNQAIQQPLLLYMEHSQRCACSCF